MTVAEFQGNFSVTPAKNVLRHRERGQQRQMMATDLQPRCCYRLSPLIPTDWEQRDAYMHRCCGIHRCLQANCRRPQVEYWGYSERRNCGASYQHSNLERDGERGKEDFGDQDERERCCRRCCQPAPLAASRALSSVNARSNHHKKCEKAGCGKDRGLPVSYNSISCGLKPGR